MQSSKTDATLRLSLQGKTGTEEVFFYLSREVELSITPTKDVTFVFVGDDFDDVDDFKGDIPSAAFSVESIICHLPESKLTVFVYNSETTSQMSVEEVTIMSSAYCRFFGFFEE